MAVCSGYITSLPGLRQPGKLLALRVKPLFKSRAIITDHGQRPPTNGIGRVVHHNIPFAGADVWIVTAGPGRVREHAPGAVIGQDAEPVDQVTPLISNSPFKMDNSRLGV